MRIFRKIKKENSFISYEGFIYGARLVRHAVTIPIIVWQVTNGYRTSNSNVNSWRLWKWFYVEKKYINQNLIEWNETLKHRINVRNLARIIHSSKWLILHFLLFTSVDFSFYFSSFRFHFNYIRWTINISDWPKLVPALFETCGIVTVWQNSALLFFRIGTWSLGDNDYSIQTWTHFLFMSSISQNTECC